MARNTIVMGAPSMPRPVRPRRPVEALLRLARRPTASLRALPDFLIIGAQKAGTTSLNDYLQTSSPKVRPAVTKEVHYFDRHERHGTNWYRSNFPLRRGPCDWVTGESTPYYLLHPGVPAKVADLIPEVRLLVMLRHPVDRAYSHFHHSRFYGIEPEEDFERALALEGARTDEAWLHLEAGAAQDDRVEWFSYARRSTYMPQLRRWLKFFPPESLLVFTMEEMAADPRAAVERALAHIGIHEHVKAADFPVRNSRDYTGIDPGLRRQVFSMFEDDVAGVEEFLGRSVGWGP